MPARRELTMRQLRQMLRLHHDGVSAREIGRTLGVARSTIQNNLERARNAGIGVAPTRAVSTIGAPPSKRAGFLIAVQHFHSLGLVYSRWLRLGPCEWPRRGGTPL